MEECGPCPIFESFTLEFALQLRKKHGKTSVTVRKTSIRLRKTSVRVQFTYYQNTHTLQNLHKHTHYKNHTYTHTTNPHIHTHYKTHTYTHTHIHTGRREKQTSHGILVRKPEGMRRFSRTKFILDNDNKIGLKELRCGNASWICEIQHEIQS